VKLKLPDAVGVPEITPVALLRESPAGIEPAVIDQEYGAFPPLAARVAEYERLSVAPGSDVVLIASGVACTVRFVLPVIEFNAAEITVLPLLTPVASPALLTVAAAVLDEAHRT
jgi:hypothetical protein